MIVIFGGTTEGLAVAKLLDLLNEPYIYSTKSTTRQQVKGHMRSGALNEVDMLLFLTENLVSLIIDAAHPFAANLHYQLFDIATKLAIPVIRYERIYPNLNRSEIRRFADYDSVVKAVLADKSVTSVLALTGVNTILPLRGLWQSIATTFRILNTTTSLAIAKASGIDLQSIVQASPDIELDDMVALAKRCSADIIVTKESGKSGYFETKLQAAINLGIPLWVVERPVLPCFSYVVSNTKQLCQLVVKMRRDVLKKGDSLRLGLTSGTCVTASANAALYSLLSSSVPSSIEVVLPDGLCETLPVFLEELSDRSARFVVIKDAGDDPDVTHGSEIGCEIRLVAKPGIIFKRGVGIGVVTLSGLQINVGEPAINPTPRKMICSHLEALMAAYEYHHGVEVIPFITDGEELAKRTFNPRVGVVGGLSIIGTSGRVSPYSAEAFVGAIRQQVKVAVSVTGGVVVATSGKRSEQTLRTYVPSVPPQSFIHFGNFIGDTLEICKTEGITNVFLGVMVGKAMKLAEGHLDTHSREVLFNANFAAQMARDLGYSNAIVASISKLKLANAIADYIPFAADSPFYIYLATCCYKVCLSAISSKLSLVFYLISAEGNVIKIDRI